uniref:Uncharacterized protein n=1 Tax=Chromera velia CCMP2878 TaxID=1169474 RepID=A0A0G4HU65_9ALVE|eukprot:Cvel_8584.t1-p1 / transcript=Cvel_8584.t1 / gene=Cvel_8584 / organism=Chromera_velia_CCMP2878 / gene_product=hypothetical protein / transcript_product=hypothetical protein / location=Cvel_scaffold476:62140-68167(-) / protein_length=623 / sequence_SO=supercontig / SO=protein_coding / is_pseudo=false
MQMTPALADLHTLDKLNALFPPLLDPLCPPPPDPENCIPWAEQAVPNEEDIRSAIRHTAKETIPGHTGRRIERFQDLAQHYYIYLLLPLFTDIALNTCPEDLFDIFCLTILAALLKPQGGIRPVGIGDTHRTLFGKAQLIRWGTTNACKAVGPLQFSMWPSGVENYVHTIWFAYERLLQEAITRLDELYPGATEYTLEMLSKADFPFVLLTDARNFFHCVLPCTALEAMIQRAPGVLVDGDLRTLADHLNGTPALSTVFVEAKCVFKTGSTERPRAAIALHWGKGHALNTSFTLPGSAKNTVFYERALTFGAIWAIYQHHSTHLLTSLEIIINHPLLITLHNTDGPCWDRDEWKNRSQQALPNADLLRHLYRLLTYLCDHSPTPVTISTIQHSTHTYRTADWAEGRALAKEAVKQQLEMTHTLPPNTREPLKFLKDTFLVSILPENPSRRHPPNLSEVTDTPTWTLEGKLQQTFTRWTHAFYYLNTLERLQRTGTVGTPLWREAQCIATRLLALASKGANAHIAALPLNQYKLTRWARSVQWEIVHRRVMGLPLSHVEVLGDAADPKHTCPTRKEAEPTADEIAEKEQLLTHLGSLIPLNEAGACIPPEDANRLREMVHDLRL